MATVTKAANAHTVVTTGWTNPSNAFASVGNNVYATAAPAKNATVNGDFAFPAFTTADIPDGASINSVTVTTEWKVSTTTSATLGVQIRNGGAALGAETTFSSTTEAQSTQQVTSGVALADLRSAGTVVARVRDSRAASNTAHTGSLDFVSLTVDFTAATTFTDSGSGTVTVSGSATEAVVYTDSRSGTITLTGAAQESFSGPTVFTDSGSGTVSLTGTRAESAAHASSGTGSLTLSGGRSESFAHSAARAGTVTLSGSSTESWSQQAGGGGGSNYAPHEFRNGREFGLIGEDTLSEFRRLDKYVSDGGAGYAAERWANDRINGELGPHVLARLNAMCAALADPSAHYTPQGFANDKLSGHLGPHLLARLNELEAEIARLRP